MEQRDGTIGQAGQCRCRIAQQGWQVAQPAGEGSAPVGPRSELSPQEAEQPATHHRDVAQRVPGRLAQLRLAELPAVNCFADDAAVDVFAVSQLTLVERLQPRPMVAQPGQA